MPTCPRCASELRPEWKFCVMCGTHRSAADRPADGALTRSGAVVLVAAASTGAAIIGGTAVLVSALV